MVAAVVFFRQAALSGAAPRAFSTLPSIMQKHAHPDHNAIANLKLLAKRPTGMGESQILTFSTDGHDFADLTVPSGVKLVIDGKVKSYSPVNLPSNGVSTNTMDLLVKPYEPGPVGGGGFGAFLCSLNVGSTAPLIIKPNRVVHGSTDVPGRWKYANLLGGGTGIAPLIQIARAQLAAGGYVRMLSVNRGDDILMKEELDEMTREHGEKFMVRYLDTEKEGRGDAGLARSAFHLDGDDFQVFVCGTDGFVDHWCGGIVRDENNKKVQGSVRGILGEIGVKPESVYKF